MAGMGSHPTRVRGLKLYLLYHVIGIQSVAPHEGAWIEIASSYNAVEVVESHPTRVRGLKYRLLA